MIRIVPASEAIKCGELSIGWRRKMKKGDEPSFERLFEQAAEQDEFWTATPIMELTEELAGGMEKKSGQPVRARGEDRCLRTLYHPNPQG